MLTTNNKGSSHWKWQRRSAWILIPLSLWMIVSIVHHIGVDYAVAKTWVQQVPVALGLCVFVIALYYHAKLGLQTIIEDYIANDASQKVCMMLSNFICWFSMGLGLVSILKIFLKL